MGDVLGDEAIAKMAMEQAQKAQLGNPALSMPPAHFSSLPPPPPKKATFDL